MLNRDLSPIYILRVSYIYSTCVLYIYSICVLYIYIVHVSYIYMCVLYIYIYIVHVSYIYMCLILLLLIDKKVKWSRHRPGVAHSVGRGIALLFHDCGTRRRWVVSSTPRPHFTPRKDPVPILQEAGWAPGPVWTGEKSRPHRDSIPDHPARSQSLYRLSYRAHTLLIDIVNKIWRTSCEVQCFVIRIPSTGWWGVLVHLAWSADRGTFLVIATDRSRLSRTLVEVVP